MLVPHYDIRLSVAEQQALEALQRAGKTPQQSVRRVHIVLLAHAQLSNQAIADAVGTSRNLVQKWRKRFALWEPSPLVPETAVAPLARLEALLGSSPLIPVKWVRQQTRHFAEIDSQVVSQPCSLRDCPA